MLEKEIFFKYLQSLSAEAAFHFAIFETQESLKRAFCLLQQNVELSISAVFEL